MATDYGTDVAGVDDWPDPEQLVSGDLNVAYALARRLMTPAGALEDIGETEFYDSIDVRDWLGGSADVTDIDALKLQATQVLSQDERVLSVSVAVSLTGSLLAVAVDGRGTAGPFSFVLKTDGVTSTLLRGG